MKATSILRAAAWAGLVTLVLGMQTALAEPLVYVPLGGAGKIVVVDAATDEIVDTIAGVTAVHGLAGTPDGQFLIAGSFEEREADGETLAKPSGISEDEHAAHHGGSAAVAGKVDSVVSTLSVISTADGAVVRRIDVPGAVHHVAVSPDGRFAVVTHPNEGAISAIDLDSFQVVTTVATGPLPNYAAFSPDARKVYVSNAGNDTVSAVDTGRWIVQWNADAGGSPEHVVLSGDGAALYVNNVDDGTVSVIGVGERKVVKTIPIGSTLHGIDLSDDGRTLFVAALGEDKLVGIDLATGAYRSAFLAPAPYHLAAVRGIGKLYVSSADEPKIWVIDQRDLTVLGEIPIGGKGHQMVMAPGS
jgi:YVTN family beta-propeller protein